jgi:hypothetical protein
MSITVMSAVWHRSGQEGKNLLVLLALADNANEDTGYAWPSVATLARKSRMSERSVQRALRDLEEAKEISTVRAGGRVNGAYRSTVYAVHPQGCQSVVPDAAGVTDQALRGDTALSPKPSKEPSTSLSKREKKPVKLADEIAGFADWLGYHVEQASARGLSMSVPAPATMARTDLHKRFEALAGEGRTLEDMKLASLGLLSSEWHRQEGHTKLITVLRQPEKLQERIDAGRAAQVAEKTSSKYAHLGV